MKKENKNRKELVGTVVSAKNNKTITVLVENYKKDPIYGKRFKRTKKYTVHDEDNAAKEGDIVRIIETNHISKTKYFYLAEIIKESVIL